MGTLLFLPENLIRVTQIAIIGKHSISIRKPALFLKNSYTESVYKHDLQLIRMSYINTKYHSLFYELVNDDSEWSDINIEFIPKPVREYLFLESFLSKRKEEILNELNDVVGEASPNVFEKQTVCLELLGNAEKKLDLSTSQIISIINVSKTIARLDKSKNIKVEHLAEAIQYQSINY